METTKGYVGEYRGKFFNIPFTVHSLDIRINPLQDNRDIYSTNRNTFKRATVIFKDRSDISIFDLFYEPHQFMNNESVVSILTAHFKFTEVLNIYHGEGFYKGDEYFKEFILETLNILPELETVETMVLSSDEIDQLLGFDNT